jgi:hypothetical protein
LTASMIESLGMYYYYAGIQIVTVKYITINSIIDKY